MMATTLTACSPEPDPAGDAHASAAPTATVNNADAPEHAKTLLASWQSYSYNPPQYAVENLLIFSDFSCSVSAAAQAGENPCRWKRDDNDQLLFSFPNSNKVTTARLRAAKSHKGKQQPGKAGYLLIQLADQRQQIFVLDESPDAQMVQQAIDGETLWNAGQRQQGIAKLTTALQLGSTWARLRLGWLYATNSAFLRPALALQLLKPLENNQSQAVQDALAAAYAANHQFPQAIERGVLACSLANREQQAVCEQRVTLYRQHKPFIADPGAN